MPSPLADHPCATTVNPMGSWVISSTALWSMTVPVSRAPVVIMVVIMVVIVAV